MKWGGSILALLRKFGFGGAVHPVNPRADAVQGIKAWPSVQAIGQPVDVAVIALPQERTEAAFEDCAAAGVKVILMVTSQFAESGAEGAALQDKLLAIARRAGMRIIGPNCMGYFNSHADMNLLNSLSNFEAANSITSAQANEIAEAGEGLHQASLIYLGLVLFFITFVVLSLSKILLSRLKKSEGSRA